ncbi:MAG: hypothetical protein HGA65_11055, partial [Oscillochloris sp.]|nr:hypothetical protein [Oscillochloris sp.]
MSHPISVLMGSLRQTGQEAVSGCYTPATLAQLSQSLARITLTGKANVVLAAGGEQQRSWAFLRS